MSDSLQSYLQKHLAHESNVTKQKIHELKQEYRRMYLSRYRKKYRENYMQISFHLNNTLYEQLLITSKKQDLKVPAYVKQLARQSLGKGHNSTIQPIRLILLELIDHVEETIYEQEVLDKQEVLDTLTQMLQQMNDC